jgi:hypothetical protein
MVCVLLVPRQVAAHVLVQDTVGKTGAIVHFSPNDNPIAGESTGIFYDVQTGQDLNQAALHLRVTTENNSIDEAVPLTAKGHTVSGAFEFPARGLYFLILTIDSKVDGPKVEPLTFKYSLQVAKSSHGSDPAPQVPAWTTFGMVMSVWLFAALGLIAFRRRKQIGAKSR